MMMIDRQSPNAGRLPRTRATLVVALLLGFALPAAVIDFFHEEETIIPSDRCPACQLQQSAAAAHVAAAPDLPEPSDQELEWVWVQQLNEPLFRVSPASRSPPLA